jgi:hypothetical protein
VLRILILVLGVLVLGRVWAAYDLMVYGATPQGVTAAVAAARAGLKVVVLEPSARVGGVLTGGGLATLDLGLANRRKPFQQGLFAEFYRRIGGHPSFDVGRAERALRGMLEEAGAELRLNAALARVRLEGNRVLGATFVQDGKYLGLEAPLFIDASDTAELAYAAGAEFTVGREDTGLDKAQMAAGLSFRLEGVPWWGVWLALNYDGVIGRSGSGAWGSSAWGFGRLGFAYNPSDPQRYRLRGLNLARQDDGSVWVNALLIYGVDGTTQSEDRRLYREAAAEVGRVVEYLRRANPALFGTARLVEIAPELYIRESRHLRGLYRLGADDVLYGRDFPDTVAVGSYPLDGQSYRRGEALYLLGTPAPYGVPFRTMVPRGLGNLLVVSQAASYDSVAAFSARVVPLQMALGEAAGTAAYFAKVRNLEFPALAADPEPLRERLLRQGANLLPESADPGKDAANPGYGAAIELYRRGLFSTPYFMVGQLYLEDSIAVGDFLIDLEHFYQARYPGSPALGVIQGEMRFFQGGWRRALYRPDAYRILGRLGMHLGLPEDNRPLRRGEAAALLWELFRPGLTTQKASPVRPHGCRPRRDDPRGEPCV